jgi:hypothetical protein
MSDRVDRVIAKIRAIHKEVRIPKWDLSTAS